VLAQENGETEEVLFIELGVERKVERDLMPAARKYPKKRRLRRGHPEKDCGKAKAHAWLSSRVFKEELGVKVEKSARARHRWGMRGFHLGGRPLYAESVANWRLEVPAGVGSPQIRAEEPKSTERKPNCSLATIRRGAALLEGTQLS